MEDVLLDLADKAGISFQLGDVIAAPISALRSQEVTQAMLSLGTISMNIAAPKLFDETNTTNSPLMGILFDYALETAPRMNENENIIDVAELEKHVDNMKQTFGDIKISPQLINNITQGAHVRFNLEKTAAEMDTPKTEAGSPE